MPEKFVARTYALYDRMLDQPHLLIAGATGSGKSVVINGLIYHILCMSPRDVPGGGKLILIDPKRVELIQWRETPHCIRYASEPDTMLDALHYAMELTENRYKAMQDERSRKYSGSDVYIIIDEFADLMTTQRREVQPLIQRLAQIGRAARIHIILATQTPIRDVIPTVIKCNFDARVGLRARSEQDSRNILGRGGLEKLPKYGQGIYMDPDGTGLYSLPYYTDAELDKIVEFWKPREQAKPTAPAELEQKKQPLISRKKRHIFNITRQDRP